jgi:hypothetical protein
MPLQSTFGCIGEVLRGKTSSVNELNNYLKKI